MRSAEPHRAQPKLTSLGAATSETKPSSPGPRIAGPNIITSRCASDAQHRGRCAGRACRRRPRRRASLTRSQVFCRASSSSAEAHQPGRSNERDKTVFPRRAQHVPKPRTTILNEVGVGTCEHAFGEDRGTQARSLRRMPGSTRAGATRVGASREPARARSRPRRRAAGTCRRRRASKTS
jgi:hypothetical protein